MAQGIETENRLPTVQPLNLPPMDVETRVSPEQLAQMIRRVEECFSNVRYESPFQYDTENAFFAVGRGQISLLKIAAARCGASLEGIDTCLELGCGHGRATIPLSEIFPHVIAADASGPHLKAARDNAARAGRGNITFLHANTVQALAALPPYDLFYSKFAVQHSPPPVIRHVLDLVLSKLKPGGLAYFQIAVYQLGYKFNAARYLATAPNYHVPEMHMLPQHELFELLADHGCRLLEVREDGSAGKNSLSFHLLARKQ